MRWSISQGMDFDMSRGYNACACCERRVTIYLIERITHKLLAEIVDELYFVYTYICQNIFGARKKNRSGKKFTKHQATVFEETRDGMKIFLAGRSERKEKNIE